MNPPIETSTQQVHIIKLECIKCNGRGGIYPDSNSYQGPGSAWLHCVHCNKGMRKWLVWMLKGQPYNKNPNEIQKMLLIENYSPYQSGSTVSTPDGDRIAGEVSLKRVKDIVEGQNVQSIIKTVESINGWSGNTYLCIAESNPAVGEEQ